MKSIRYLVEALAQPTPVCCWATALLMLERWQFMRLGLFARGPSSLLENLVGPGSTPAQHARVKPLRHQDLQGVIEVLGFAWKYVPTHPSVIAQNLQTHGPLVYVAKLGGGSQHCLLLCGIETNREGLYQLQYNDPSGGRRIVRDHAGFAASYPPFFNRQDAKAGAQTAIIYAPNPYKKATRITWPQS